MADKAEAAPKKQAVTEEKKVEAEPAPEAPTDAPAAPTPTPTLPLAQPAPTPTPILEETSSEEKEEENEIPLEKRNTKLYVIGIVLSIFVLGATVGLFYFRSRQTKEEVESTETEIEEVAEVTPTPIPTTSSLSREEISLEILNGSGVAGAAAETASIFEELGYEIVEIGNADEVEGNQLYVDSDLEDLLDQLLEDVGEKLDIASISGKLTNSTASARIILGK